MENPIGEICIMADFVTDDVIVEYFRNFDKCFELSSLPEWVRSGAYQTIVCRSDSDWDSATKTILMNGDASRFLSIRETPIVIDSMKILYPNDSNNDMDLNVDQSSDDKQIVLNRNTGLVELLGWGQYSPLTFGFDSDQMMNFPFGLQNVEITGSFGSDVGVSSLLRQLQLFLMTQTMSRINPEIYGKGDFVSEKIGKYSYEVYGRSQTQSKRLTVDMIIDELFDLLPNSVCLGDI